MLNLKTMTARQSHPNENRKINIVTEVVARVLLEAEVEAEEVEVEVEAGVEVAAGVLLPITEGNEDMVIVEADRGAEAPHLESTERSQNHRKFWECLDSHPPREMKIYGMSSPSLVNLTMSI